MIIQYDGKIDEYKTEDSGQALIAEIDKENSALYVRLISYDEDKKHEDFEKLKNKKIKITIETLD